MIAPLRIDRCELSELDDATVARLRVLTLPPRPLYEGRIVALTLTSAMATRLDFRDGIDVLIARRDGEIVGWAIVEEATGQIMLYVDKAHRRRGIGRALVAAVLPLETWGSPHDEASTAFFARVCPRGQPARIIRILETLRST